MATLKRQPQVVSGLLLAALAATVAMIVVPVHATSATATASVSALGTHNRAEVIAGTAGQVFKVTVNYPPEAPQPPSVAAGAAAPCALPLPSPLDRDLPPIPSDDCVPDGVPPSDVPTVEPSVPNVPLPGGSVVPTPIASVPVPTVDPSDVPTVDPSAVPSVDPSVQPSVPNVPLPGGSVLPTPIASVPVPGVPSVQPSVPNVPLPGGSVVPMPIDVPIPPDTPNVNVGPPANFIQITVPTNLITLQSGPAYMIGAWTCRNFPSTSRVVCRGGALLPGASESFVVIGNVLRPAADTTGTWSVSTSDDDGNTLIPASPLGVGSLNTTARVLQVHNVEITAPAGAVDDIVTQEQDNIEVRCDVTNSGSAALNVTPALTGTIVSSSTAPAAALVGPVGGTASFTFTDVTVGTDETGAMLCNASAAGAWGVPGVNQITLQTKVGIDPVGVEAVTPNDVVQGATYGLSIAANKNGEATVDSGLTGVLSFNDGTSTFTAALEDPDALGEAGGVTLSFASTQIDPAFTDGSFGLSLQLDGIDNNGAVVSLEPSMPDIIVNNALPLIDPTLSLPKSRVPSQPDATFNGATLGFGGEVSRGGTNCTTCTLVSARLVQFDAMMGALPDIDVSDAVTLGTAGEIGGQYTGDYDPAATSVQLELTVKDNADRSTSLNRSPLVDVDNVAPMFVRAVTGGPSHDNKHRIDVWLSEPVGGKTFGPLDFLMGGNLVTHAYREGNRITLETLLPLGEDERPQLFFASMCLDPAFYNTPLCSELYDRVGHPVARANIVAFDGINPAVPALKAVDGDKGDYEAGLRTFYSNDSQTLFTVGRVTIGHTLTLVLDTDDSGTLDPTDMTILNQDITAAECVSDPDAHDRCLVEVESSPVVMEGPYTVFGRATDAFQMGDWDRTTPAVEPAPRNTGGHFAETVVFDFTKPVLTDFDWDGNVTVDVEISEDVFGRDFGADWLALAVPSGGGAVQTFQIGTVEGEDDERTLTIDDDAFNPLGWNVIGVVYEYVGPTPTPVVIPSELAKAGRILRAINGPDEQYHDRATNLLDSGATYCPACP